MSSIKTPAKKNIPQAYKFLGVMAIIYIFGLLVSRDYFLAAALQTSQMFLDVLPILGLVFCVLWAVNYSVNSGGLKRVLAHVHGVKGWLIVMAAGILIGGPPYVLYPLLKELKEQGMSQAHLAVFLYNRNVKIPFIPVSIYYFGILYTLILSVLLIFFSVINGLIIGKLNKPSTS